MEIKIADKHPSGIPSIDWEVLAAQPYDNMRQRKVADDDAITVPL